MAAPVNQRVVLARRPAGVPDGSRFRVEEAPVPALGALAHAPDPELFEGGHTGKLLLAV